jgi:hypothetical protein
VTSRLTVLDPLGFPPVSVHGALAARLETLEGKTVYLVDCQFENSGVLLEQVREWFREHMPGVEMPIVRWRGEVYANEDRGTLEEVAAGGDAAILGVGL